MTGLAELGDSPASLLTLGLLSDMGYEVDFSAADASYLPRADCCDGSVDYGQLDPTRRNLRSATASNIDTKQPHVRKLSGNGPRELSDDLLTEAEDYGKQLLKDAKFKGKLPEDVMYVGDKFKVVFVLDGESVYEVLVTN